MPSINKGESEDKYVARCTPIVAKEKGIPFDEAAARCHGMYKQHKEKGTQYEDEEYFEPPESGDAPESVKSILRAAYNSCRSQWVKEHPDDKENEANKTSCSKQAWSAVKNAGWHKDKEGNWEKSEHEAEIKSYSFECTMQEFTLQSVLIESKDGPVEDKDWIKVRAVAVVGDRMMRNAFIPYKALKESVNKWNGTYHDINHMGTSYPDTIYPFKRQNIEYVIGYQDNAEANDSTKEVSMDVNILKTHPKYAAWKSFCDINTKANKVPNVSMSIDARFRKTRVRDLDNESREYAKINGYSDDDIIEYLEEIYPKALTTCIQGVCDSKSGCGLATKIESEDCGCKGNCNIQKDEKANDGVVSDEDAKYLESLKNKTKKLKDEKYLAEINERIKKLKGEK